MAQKMTFLWALLTVAVLAALFGHRLGRYWAQMLCLTSGDAAVTVSFVRSDEHSQKNRIYCAMWAAMRSDLILRRF